MFLKRFGLGYVWPRKPDWHRKAVGGLWHRIGRLQFKFLKKQGLQPQHYFLDIGCGSLRGGVHFINFLHKGHYYGIEKETTLIKAGEDLELKKRNLLHKNPHIFHIEDFDISQIGHNSFDFMLAQSVFTHLAPELIDLCLRRVMPYLTSDGKFFATFFESDDINLGEPHPWRKNEQLACRYPFSMFKEIGANLHVAVKYLGEWGHPRNQKMLVFHKV